MLEVMFSESAKGAMRFAKNFVPVNIDNGAIGYSGDQPSESDFQHFTEGKAVGGSSKDVVSIGFSLDIGCINGEVDGPGRQKVYQKLWGKYNDSSEEQIRFFKEQRTDYEKLLSFAEKGEHIRCWKSNKPFSICGFYFVCWLLRNSECEISVVSLPEYNQITEDALEIFNDWGEVASGMLYKYLPLERKLSNMEINMFSQHWEDLVAENAELRASVNGKLISVPEDFYDHIIENNLSEDEFIMGHLIGELMLNYALGVSDRWYELRLDKMIKEGKLIVVNNNNLSHPYEKILKNIK